jgi:hypothetical protein
MPLIRLIPSSLFELNVKFYGEPLEKVEPYRRAFVAFRNPISEHLALFCNLIDRHFAPRDKPATDA